jgi:hypothetical protein
MTTSDSAKKGFKTFILTLSVSLIIFSVIYYVLTNNTGSAQNQNTYTKQAAVTTPTTVTTDTQVAAAIKDTTSPFKKLQNAPVNAQPQEVLGTETAANTSDNSVTVNNVVAVNTAVSPQSTIPSTGTVSITIGLLLSLTTFIAGLIWLTMNPRKIALQGFEKRATKESK